jgi:hypothetical protein
VFDWLIWCSTTLELGGFESDFSHEDDKHDGISN